MLMKLPLNILFLEDVKYDAELIWHEIDKNKIEFQKLLVDTKEAFIDGIKSFIPDIIISDYSLPQLTGMDALLIRNEMVPFTPFLLVTGSINEEVAVDCIKAGADDYILKENLSRLAPAIQNSLNKYILKKEKKAAEEELLRSEQRLHKAQAMAHVGNWELDLSEKNFWCSDESLLIYGLQSANHEISLEVAQKVPLAEYRPVLDESLNNLLKYNEPYEVEFRIRRVNDGIIRWIVSKAELVVESSGSQVKVVGVIQDITERKLSEEALAFNNLLLRTQQEASIDAILIVDENDKIINYNSRFIDFAKIPRSIVESGQDIHVRDYVAKQTINPGEFIKKIKHLNKFPEEITRDEVIFKDGRTYDRYSAPMFGPDKKFYGRVWYFREITDRKKADEAIIQERRMLRTLIDNLPDPIYVEDIECRKVIANKADIENSGCTTESQVLGKTDLELFPGNIGTRGYAEDRKIIETGNPVFDLEEEFITKKGEIRWLQTTKVPLHDKNGKITGLVGIGHDITQRKRVETELLYSSMFNKSLLDTIPFGMDIVDEQGTVLFQSDNFVRMVGEKALGKKCWDLYKDDRKQCAGCPLIEGITIGQTEVYESHGVLGNRIFEISHTGMVYQGKKAILEIFQDITERKVSEQELIHAKEKAEESDKLKTAFLHNISHEIRTPMNAIVGFSTLLGEPENDEATRKSYIDVIMQSSNHLLAIISDIVDISNIEANLIKIVKNEVDTNIVLNSLYNQFLPRANEKKIHIDFETSLPDSEATIVTDKTKLTQILTNMINNALKFTDKGSVHVTCDLKDNFLEFSVSDTGIGISEQHHKKIFDRFYQVQNSVSRLYEGTGLGLAISKAYVELLGGRLWLESEPGVGSTFYFTVAYEKAVHKEARFTERKSPDKFAFPEKKVILVAEDIDSNFKLVKYFLDGSNTEIIHAWNGKEAVDKFVTMEKIDLVLMDMKMPVMDGYAAVRLIREKNSKIPIIAQTAYADDRDKAIDCGCSGFISKPFDRKGLFKVINEYI